MRRGAHCCPREPWPRAEFRGGGSRRRGAHRPRPRRRRLPRSGGRLFVDPLQRSPRSVTSSAIALLPAKRSLAACPAIAVVDRVGNVLAVFAMIGTPRPRISRRTIAGSSGRRRSGVRSRSPDCRSGDRQGGHRRLSVEQRQCSSTRTASQIVQEHFPPAPTTVGLESGPLFGVQFSQRSVPTCPRG